MKNLLITLLLQSSLVLSPTLSQAGVTVDRRAKIADELVDVVLQGFATKAGIVLKKTTPQLRAQELRAELEQKWGEEASSLPGSMIGFWESIAKLPEFQNLPTEEAFSAEFKKKMARIAAWQAGATQRGKSPSVPPDLTKLADGATVTYQMVAQNFNASVPASWAPPAEKTVGNGGGDSEPKKEAEADPKVIAQ